MLKVLSFVWRFVIIIFAHIPKFIKDEIVPAINLINLIKQAITNLEFLIPAEHRDIIINALRTMDYFSEYFKSVKKNTKPVQMLEDILELLRNESDTIREALYLKMSVAIIRLKEENADIKDCELEAIVQLAYCRMKAEEFEAAPEPAQS